MDFEASVSECAAYLLRTKQDGSNSVDYSPQPVAPVAEPRSVLRRREEGSASVH